MAAAGLSCTLLGSSDPAQWSELRNFDGTGAEVELLDAAAVAEGHKFYRVRVNLDD